MDRELLGDPAIQLRINLKGFPRLRNNTQGSLGCFDINWRYIFRLNRVIPTFTMSSPREQLVYMSKLAEEAERYVSVLKKGVQRVGV